MHRVGDHAGGTFAMKALKCQRPAIYICSAPQKAHNWAFPVIVGHGLLLLTFAGNLAHAHAVCSTPSFPQRAGEHTLDLLDKYLHASSIDQSSLRSGEVCFRGMSPALRTPPAVSGARSSSLSRHKVPPLYECRISLEGQSPRASKVVPRRFTRWWTGLNGRLIFIK